MIRWQAFSAIHAMNFKALLKLRYLLIDLFGELDYSRLESFTYAVYHSAEPVYNPYN